MFTSLLVASLGASVAAQGPSKQICLPPVHSADRYEWDNTRFVYARSREYIDFPNLKFHITGYDDRDENPDFAFHNEMIIFAGDGQAKAYFITGEAGGHLRCEERKYTGGTPHPPCWASNATRIEQSTIGNQLIVDDFYSEFQPDPRNKEYVVHDWIQVTKAGIPFVNAHWTRPGDAEVSSLFNVNTTVPSDAFDIPSICQNAVQSIVPVHSIEHARHTVRKGAGAQPRVEGQPVCLPKVHKLDRLAWKHDTQGRPDPSFERSRIYADYDAGKYRMLDRTAMSPGPIPIDVAIDFLVRKDLNKVFFVTAIPPFQRPNCTVATYNGDMKDPCLTNNGTYMHTDTVGGQGGVVVDSFFAQVQEPESPLLQYLHILITKTGVPVMVRHHEQVNGDHYDHWVEVFENFNSTIPSNAFDVPDECNKVEPSFHFDAKTAEALSRGFSRQFQF
jgi:hypothetical protein